MREQEMPVGLGFSLAVNEKAMSHFAEMSDKEKRQVMEAARQAQTRKEMEQIIRDIADLEEFK